MCSVIDGDIEDLSNSMHVLKLKPKTLPLLCNKCKEEKPCLILRKKDAYCKACFLANTLHKFKAILGKHKLIRENDNVLIYHKGGHPSTALLHFLQMSIDLDTPKKLRFVPIGLWIEREFYTLMDEHLENMRKIESEMKMFNIPIYFTSLTHYLNRDNTEGLMLVDNPEKLFLHNSKPVSTMFEASESLTNDLKILYERKILIAVAKKLNCKFIFTVDISTDIASNLLSNIALGRGSQIPYNTGFQDNRDEQVTILRPLRLFDIKELALYNYFNRLNPVTIREDSENSHKSIQSIIGKFVNDLQSDYPATVTTVLKTGDKLSAQTVDAQNSKLCSICQSPIGISSKHYLTSKMAIQFSHKISTQSSIDTAELLQEETSMDTCFSCSEIKPFLITGK